MWTSWIIYLGLLVIFWAVFRHVGVFRGRPSWLPPVFLSGVMGVFAVTNMMNEQFWAAAISAVLALSVLLAWRLQLAK